MRAPILGRATTRAPPGTVDRIRNLTRNQMLILLALAAPVAVAAHRAYGSISRERLAERIVVHAETIARAGFDHLMNTGDFPAPTADGSLPPEIQGAVTPWDELPSVSFAWSHWSLPHEGPGSPERLLAGVVVRTGDDDSLARAVRSNWKGPAVGPGRLAVVLLFENAP